MFSKEEKQQLVTTFWADFKTKSKQKYGNRHTWILKRTGVKGVQLKFHLDRNKALVLLQCYGLSLENKQMLFDILAQYHIVIAEIAGEKPIWDREGEFDGLEKQPSVYYVLEGVDYLQQKDWDEIHSFFMDRMKRMENAFLEIKDVLKVEAKALL